jgi:aminoglycoside phosphotransferase (APT) family kinase protein
MNFMIPNNSQGKIIQKVQEILAIKVVNVQIPKQGMDGTVFIIRDENGDEYAVKYSNNAFNDVLSLELIKKNNLQIPVPKLYGHFPFEKGTVVILEKINFPLLETVPQDKQHTYINSMLANLNKIHSIKSSTAGLLNSQDRSLSWKEWLLFKYSDDHPWFRWKEIMAREGVNSDLIKSSVGNIRKKIQEIELKLDIYSFLHTDFNQRNLFVNPETDEIAAIVDWGEAMFGDPLYDFARIRMYIWHFKLKNNTLEDYYKFLQLTSEEEKREDLYLVSQVLDYIASYSEYTDDFNKSRLQLHQDFLKEYQW